MSDINANYNNLTTKNSTITALLSSISETQDTQQEILKAVGVNENLRADVGTKLTDLSAKVNQLQSQVNSGSDKVSDIEGAIDNFRKAIH